MDTTDLMAAARVGIAEVAAELSDIVSSLPDTATPIRPGTWTIREAAVHLALETGDCAELAAGSPVPSTYTNSTEFNAWSEARIADITETDPAKLAALMGESAERFLAITARRPAEEIVTWYGVPISLTHVAGITLGEWVLHGYDVATATGRPWSIDPAHARLAAFGLSPAFPIAVNPATAQGHTAAYAINLRGGEGVVMRFADGALSVEPAESGPVDCVLDADPVAFLLVASGRISQWQAIALGLLSASGDRPDLALGFLDLFDIA